MLKPVTGFGASGIASVMFRSRGEPGRSGMTLTPKFCGADGASGVASIVRFLKACGASGMASVILKNPGVSGVSGVMLDILRPRGAAGGSPEVKS